MPTLAEKYPEQFAKLVKTAAPGASVNDEADAANLRLLEESNAAWSAKLAAEEAKQSEGRKEMLAMWGAKVFGAVLIGLGIWKNQDDFVQYGATLAGVGAGGLTIARTGVKMVRELAEAKKRP